VSYTTPFGQKTCWWYFLVKDLCGMTFQYEYTRQVWLDLAALQATFARE
jgi:hypothetical protein